MVSQKKIENLIHITNNSIATFNNRVSEEEKNLFYSLPEAPKKVSSESIDRMIQDLDLYYIFEAPQDEATYLLFSTIRSNLQELSEIVDGHTSAKSPKD